MSPNFRPSANDVSNWKDYLALASRDVGRLHGRLKVQRFDYMPPALQPATPRRLKAPYPVSVAYTEWGARDAPVLLCVGGAANVAMRFSDLAADLRDQYRVVCMDWLGRGRSGWLAARPTTRCPPTPSNCDK